MPDTIDIFDADLRPLGSMDRKEAHRAGHWHRTYHCWIVRAEPVPALLFQRRALTMRNFPGLLDVSAAGHIETGETVDEGVREVTEELGLARASFDPLYIGDRVEVADQTNGQRNREYQAVHLAVLDANIPLKPDPSEVWGVYWMQLDEGLDLFSGRTDAVDVVGLEYDQASNTYPPSQLRVSIDDFLPRHQRYYLAALIASERLLQGKPDIAIS